MKVLVYSRPGKKTNWADEFSHGLRKHGIAAQITNEFRPCDMLVIWGTHNQQLITMQKKSGGEVCICERGYLGDRFKWTSVSFGGGLNNRGIYRGPFDDETRWRKHFPELLQAWRTPEGYALLVGQVAGDMSLSKVNVKDWYKQTAVQLKKLGWTVRFRPHPLAVKRGQQITLIKECERIGTTLQESLAGAGLVVTYNSNTGVEAVCAGVPTVTFDEGAMAWPVTGHSCSEIIMPDRTEWISALAWKQWLGDEIRSGECWDAIQPIRHEVQQRPEAAMVALT